MPLVNTIQAEERTAFVAWWLVQWFGHIAAAIASMVIGWFVLAVIGVFSQRIAELGFVLVFCVSSAAAGYKLNKRYGHSAALWVWIPFLVLFSVGASELLHTWNPNWSNQSRLSYATSNLFTNDCGATECLYAAICTVPLFGSVSYALGAWLGERRRTAMLVSLR